MLKKIIPAFMILTLCSGCINTAVTGPSVAYKRYNLEHELTDKQIILFIKQSIRRNKQFIQSDIKVDCFNLNVLLTGSTHSDVTQKKVTAIAADTRWVKHVYNFVKVGPKITTSKQLKDDWITTKIKSTIIAKAKVDPHHIKVVTENGVVYLMGILTHSQAKEIVTIARYTKGVKRVIEIFEYYAITHQ